MHARGKRITLRSQSPTSRKTHRKYAVAVTDLTAAAAEATELPAAPRSTARDFVQVLQFLRDLKASKKMGNLVSDRHKIFTDLLHTEGNIII